MCGLDTTCCRTFFKDYQIFYQPKTRILMLNKKENMSIRLEKLDKPKSIIDLEEIWLF